MKKETVLIIGAQSDIAKSLAKKFAENNYDLILTARNIDQLKTQSTDLKVRYNIDIDIHEFNILTSNNYENFFKNLKKIPAITVFAIGFLGEQKENEKKFDLRSEVLKVNYEGPVNIISEIANIYEDQMFGTNWNQLCRWR